MPGGQNQSCFPETTEKNEAYHVKGYSPKGKTPEIASYNRIETLICRNASLNISIRPPFFSSA